MWESIGWHWKAAWQNQSRLPAANLPARDPSPDWCTGGKHGVCRLAYVLSAADETEVGGSFHRLSAIGAPSSLPSCRLAVYVRLPLRLPGGAYQRVPLDVLG